MGKSTYARVGVLVNVTPFEPEWEGFVTVSIANTTPASVRIFAQRRPLSGFFFQSDEPCEVSYKDRKGKYQAQKKIETVEATESAGDRIRFEMKFRLDPAQIKPTVST